jgi:ubiquinone biosynthesis UbiH/UbiF/VisC/COQ6 family hydroxylase
MDGIITPVEVDLIVVGGGPVGAALARAARGLLSLALLAPERRMPAQEPYEGFDARVYALSPGNVRFLDELGAMPWERAIPVHAMRVYGDDASRIEFDAYRAGVPALAWILEDRLLQDALWRGLEAQVGVPESLEAGADRAVLGLAGGRRFRAHLVAGADGARSFVRERAGIAADDKPYGQVAVVANFACERAHANIAYQWFQKGPVLALLPLAGAHVSMVWSLPAPEAERIRLLPPEALCRELQAATGSALGQLSLVTAPRSYPLRRLSSRRLVAPRVALLGDAAHVIHPLAGQGLNLGLQDVRALSQALASRGPMRDAGDPRVLRRYERSRAEPILAMDTMVSGLYSLFGAPGPLAGRLRNAGLNLTDRVPVLKNLLIRQALN